jgi:hypothetical protein
MASQSRAQESVLQYGATINFIPVRVQPETVARDLENSDPQGRGIAVLFFYPWTTKRWRS